MTAVPPTSDTSSPGPDPIPPVTDSSAQTGGPRVVEDAPRRKGKLRAFLTSGSLDIQSKLLVMLLAVSIIAALVVGVVGYLNGRASLENAAFNQVTSLREARITELKRSFDQFTQTVVAQTRNESVIGATKAFSAG